MALKYSGATRGGGSGDAAFTMRITNLNQWLRSIEKDYKDGIEAGRDALDKSLRRRVLAPSLRLCPKDTGALRESAYVSAEITSANRLHAAVGYDTDYAIYVHEDPMARHRPPTQWKFLETPLVTNGDLVAEDVLRAILKEFDTE